MTDPLQNDSSSSDSRSTEPLPARQRPLTRVEVADVAVRLFHERGYEATSATEIAEAAGVSRSTFFRQFGSKDDVIFADHDELLEQIVRHFELPHADPWLAVCEAATMVFERFRERLEVGRIRDLVVRATPVLRDRETVMVIRYERMFASYLRSSLPMVPALAAIRFAAAVTATHNYELRRLIRSTAAGARAADLPAELADELAGVRLMFRPDGRPPAGTADPGLDLLVAVFPASMDPGDVARAVEERLRAATSAPDA
ncbi:TetR family transcriptional regulator [Cryobacterium algoritolerans]|uniref:TetR family transcriptional regulator n=1 Tax=Cryobacterium algoritolerans TaxID=1259184 RepID=A0A4R8WQY0_9MICO|nr:TetR/AcrR family transcriptional regulator [Cryobacterium algoritolerans]TFC13227.1 TetR family transcriptional regulator [Cryobacterium algoritolerans]